MAESWVINASPIILLAKVGLIRHVPSLVQRLVLPQPVADEIRRCRTEDAAVQWVNRDGDDFIKPASPELAELRAAKIGLGERAVISWAIANPGFIAVLDDAEARSIAVRHGVPLLGTVGVVLKMKKAGLVPEAKPHLLAIRNAGGFISDKLFREALHSAGELS